MHPDKDRMATDFVYVTPSASTTYNFHEATEFCVTNHNGVLPTITTREDALQIQTYQNIEVNGKW